MTKALPGWMLYSDAERGLRRAGLMPRAWKALTKCPKRRFKLKPGLKRRKYWHVKQEDFDRIMLDAKASHVEEVLDDPPMFSNPPYFGRV